jgi:hypothetical protein
VPPVAVIMTDVEVVHVEAVVVDVAVQMDA